MIVLSQVLSNGMIEHLEDGVLKSWLETVLPSVLSFFWSVLLALLVAYLGGKVIKVLRRGLLKSLERKDAEEGVKQFVDQVFKVFLWIVVIIIILGLFGFTASSLAAAVASLGVTAGLALQGSLSNFAGGVLILMLHPFRVGDYIIEDNHKNEGTVIEISIFYTKLKTIDNKIIVVPNGTLANNSLTNATKSDRRQMDLVIPIGYDADIKKAKEILHGLVMAEERRLPEADTNIFVKELNGSSVDLGVRFWVSTEEYWQVRWDMLENIKLTFDAEGISIPFAQMDVHVKS
ncbi:MAG: mechanosensitive ion channel [Lachnospiraceae bacterium]|nr:mechanosensitive ion channel [Lachnospiraceae bacterium]